jgi:hypothetical protein
MEPVTNNTTIIKDSAIGPSDGLILDQLTSPRLEHVAAERAAFNLACELYDRLDSKAKSFLQERSARPRVIVLYRDSPALAEHSFVNDAPLLFIDFGNSPAIYDAVERTLQTLTERGVTMRDALPAEKQHRSDDVDWSPNEYFSFAGFPITVGGPFLSADSSLKNVVAG